MRFLGKFILYRLLPILMVWSTTHIPLPFTTVTCMISIIQVRCVWPETMLIRVVSGLNGNSHTLVVFVHLYLLSGWKNFLISVFCNCGNTDFHSYTLHITYYVLYIIFKRNSNSYFRSIITCINTYYTDWYVIILTLTLFQHCSTWINIVIYCQHKIKILNHVLFQSDVLLILLYLN